MPLITTDHSPEQYHATRALSKSGIDKLLQCPALFRAWQNGELQDSSEALLHGSVFHCLALEPQEFDARYVVQRESGTTKAGKAEKAAALESGRELVPSRIYESADGMAAAARRHMLVGKLLTSPDVRHEVSIYWEEEVEGRSIPCKARLDILARVNGFGLVACDLKSTTDADPKAIRRSMFKYAYHRQAAWYRRALRAVGLESSVFVLIFVEKTAPHIVTAANVSPAAQVLGQEDCNRAVTLWAQCSAADRWPCYASEIIELDFPDWVYRSDAA